MNRRILIWGKTYPELSERHRETVCTGGSLESGAPVRLYPVPLRYLPLLGRYRLYEWIEVPIAPSRGDKRPESHKILAPDQLKVSGWLSPAKGWLERRKVIFADRSWHYQCLEDLKARQKRDRSSMGLVKVGSIEEIKLEHRTAGERQYHEAKLLRLKQKIDLFDSTETKDLEFYPYKIKVRWRCERLEGDRPCPSHSAGVLDWGLGEMGRRAGPETAMARMNELADLDRFDLRFYMGNFKAHQGSFGIVGLWYPLRRDVERWDVAPGDLFS